MLRSQQFRSYIWKMIVILMNNCYANKKSGEVDNPGWNWSQSSILMN